MRGKRLLTLALCGAIVLGGCAGPEPEGTPMPAPTPTPTQTAAEGSFALPCYPSGGFHPITGSNRLNLTLAPLLYRGLFALDRSFNPREELCAGHEVSEDGLTWTFLLAQVTFSDGTPLTGTEAAASLNLARKSERYGQRLSDIIKVTGSGGGEPAVVVTLSRPNGALPSLLDVPIVKETEDPLRPLGTGPYYLEEAEEGLTLKAREGAQTPQQAIPLKTVGASDDLVYAFDAGEVSLVDADLTGTNMPGYSGRLETTDYPTTGLLYVGCNVKSGACAEEAVRRAFAVVFDRQDMAEEILLGHAVASTLPIHPYAAGYDRAVAETLNFDRTVAVETLAQAGWKADEEGMLVRRRAGLTLKLIVNQENTFKVTLAEELARSLEGLGCAVILEKLPWDDFADALKRGQFDLYLGETVLTADFDPSILVGTGGALNYGGCRDEELDRLLGQWRGSVGEAREEAGAALWQAMVEKVPIIPLCFKNGSLLTRWGQVRGAAPTQRDVFAGLEGWTIQNR